MRNILLSSIILCLFISDLRAQNLYESHSTAPIGYIFRLDDAHMEALAGKGSATIDTTWFRDVVDSFPTWSAYTGPLEHGNYLKVIIRDNRVEFSVLQTPPFRPVLINNRADLLVRLTSDDGIVISDAEVRVGGKVVPFDASLQAYRLRGSGRDGAMEIRHGGHVSWYTLRARHRHPRFRRHARNAWHSPPVQYVWKPVRVVGGIPFDILGTLLTFRPKGTVRHLSDGIRNLSCVLNEKSCYRTALQFQRKHTGYLVFNKPMYQPGDTVFYKGYIMKRKSGRGVGKTAGVHLVAPGQTLVLDTLKAYRRGAFTGSFLLADSLPLILDKDYRLALVTLRGGRSYISNTFRYEDYVLDGLELELSTSGNIHYRGQEFVLSVNAMDENRLPVKEGRLEVVIRRLRVLDFPVSNAFVYDTLAHFFREVQPEQPTRIVISDTICPDINMVYSAEVTLRTSDNRKISEKKEITFFHLMRRPVIELVQDSVRFSFEENGIRRETEGRVYFMHNNDLTTQLLYSGPLPYAVRLDPFVSYYSIEAESLTEGRYLHAESDARVSTYIRKEEGTRIVEISNPRRLPLTWFVYLKQKEVASGTGDDASLELPVARKGPLTVKVHYILGGSDGHVRAGYTDNPNLLRVVVTAPEVVFPGQQAEISIDVTDRAGRPVPDADITAYGVTANFKHSPTLPPSWSVRSNLFAPINSYWMRPLHNTSMRQNIDYPFWRDYGGLDTMTYYRYAWPDSGVFMGSVPNPDGISQVSPWLVSNGQFVIPHALYIDNRVVWFSWNTTHNPYSFPITEGKHNFRWVTTDHVYSFDTIIEARGKHTFFTIDMDNPPSSLRVGEYKKGERSKELSSMATRIMVYKHEYQSVSGSPYLISQGRVFDLGPTGRPGARHVTGPIYPGNSRFVFPDSSTINFTYRSWFEYNARPGLLIMQSLPRHEYMTIVSRNIRCRYDNVAFPVLTEEILRNRAVELRMQQLQKMEWIKLSYRAAPPLGNLMASPVRWDDDDKPVLLFLLHRETGLWEGVRGAEQSQQLEFRSLRPGTYALLYLFADQTYVLYDSLEVRPRCFSYHTLPAPERKPVDSLSRGAADVLHALTQGNLTRNGMLRILALSAPEWSRPALSGDQSNTVEGYVMDTKGNPVPYAIIQIKGTHYVTFTNEYGYYRMWVPDTIFTLTASGNGSEDLSKHGVSAGTHDFEVNETTREWMSMMTVSSSEIRSMPGRSRAVAFDNPFRGRILVLDELDDGLGLESEVVLSDNDLLHDYYYSFRYEKSPFTAGAVFYYDNPYPIARSADGAIDIAAASSLRSTFSDHAFWEPTLRTDRDGRASFQVTFPDDITAWSTHYLVTGGRKQFGYNQRVISSYKPLLARLYVPRFLVAGDTAMVTAVVTNYASDTVSLLRKLEIGGTEHFSASRMVVHTLTDTFRVAAIGTDSLWVKYTIHRDDGYFDGELRGIPMVKKGMEEITAQFRTLRRDSVAHLHFDTTRGDVRLQLFSSLPTMIDAELQYLIDFKYDCNEQLASRLLALLIREQTGSHGLLQRAASRRRVERILQQLADGRNDQGLWGWWKGSATSWWITEHVVYALVKAREGGYTMPVSETALITALYDGYDLLYNIDMQMDALKCILMLTPGIQLNALMKFRESLDGLDHLRQMRLWELEQMAGMEVSADSVMLLHRRTFTGEIWFGRDTVKGRVASDELISTITALRVLKNCADVHDTLTEQILNHLLRYPTHYWFSTYTRARWVDALMLFPTLTEGIDAATEASINTGTGEQQILTFPFRTTLPADAELSVKNLSSRRLFVSTDQRHQVEDPPERGDGISLRSRFAYFADTLIAGKETTIIIDVEVERDASYVMIEVPVPGGCLYGEQERPNRYETYREQFRDGTTIFCEHLPQGRHTFTVTLYPRYTGTYTLNPARAEMMYMPVVNGNTRVKRVVISYP
jgi:alpha-2-macroglobulin